MPVTPEPEEAMPLTLSGKSAPSKFTIRPSQNSKCICTVSALNEVSSGVFCKSCRRSAEAEVLDYSHKLQVLT